MAATITQNSKPLHPRALDTSGNNNHGTSYTGQGLEFDGVNDYITMLLGLMDRATAVSISLWFKTTGADGGMIAKYASSSIYSWWITVKGGKLCANINANQSAQSDLVSTSDVNDGNWHQAVLTWSYASGLASLYLDGVLIDTDANTNEVDLRNGSLNNTIGFQGYISGGVTTQAAGWYAGFLSNVQIWDTVLTASDVAYAYANPEKLVLDNPLKSIPMLTYSNLKLWYPMNDSTRGSQINVMDGANTGLSDELIDISNWNDPSHDWVANGDGSFTVNENAGGAGYIVQEYIFPLSVNLYKFTYTITNSSGTGGSNQLRFAGGNSGLGTVNLDGENGTHTVYLSSNGSKWHFQIQENGFVGTISNISLKGYNLKNHGTSKFYGEQLWANDEALLSTDYGSELITNGDMSSGTGWTLDSGWAIGSGVLTGSSVTLEATQTGILVLGRTYKVVWTIASLSGGSVKAKCGTTTGTTQTGTGTFTEYITCAGNTNFLLDGHSAFSGTIDNVSVVEVGSTSELRTGSEIASGALTYNKWYEITDQGNTELISNGGFETNVSGWSDYNGSLASGPTHNTSHAKVGAESLSFVCDAIYEAVKTTYTTVTGGTYTVSFWAKPLNSESQIRVTIIEGDGSGTIVASNYALSGLSTATGSVGSGNWYNFTYTYTEVSGGSSAEIRIGADGSDADTTFAIDEVSINQSVDFTTYGAPDNNIGTKFLVSHADGSSVPIMDSNNKAWLLDFGWAGYAGNTYSIVEEENALRIKLTQGSTVTNGMYIYFKSANTEFGTAFAIGREYKLTLKLKVSSGDDVNATIYDGASSTNLGTYNNTTFGTVNVTFIAKHATNAYFKLGSLSAGDEVWISDFSIIEQGVATGWTDADAQPTMPQLGFQSYNQLGMLNGIDSKVVVSNNSALDVGTGDFSISLWVNATSDSGVQKIFDRNHATGYTMYISSGNLKVGLHGSLTTISNNIADSKWHHLVSSYDRSGNLNVYKDSVLIATIDISSDTEDLDNSNSLAFGQSSAGTAYPFEGTLTEISLWKGEALTTAKVQELYNDGEALDALTHSSKTNLLGYWRNEGATTWTDLSTNSNNGTPTSVSEYLILPEGNNNRDTQGFLMNRDKTSGVSLLGRGENIHLGAIQFSGVVSIGAWIKPYDLTSTQCIISDGDGVGGISHRFGFGRTDNTLSFTQGGSVVATANSNAITSTGVWTYVTVVRTGSTGDWTITFYVNGSAHGSTSSISTNPDSTVDNTRIGSRGDISGLHFNGVIDDLTVYDATALTANQVLRNYKAGKRRHKD